MNASGRRNADAALLAQLATGATAEDAAKVAGVGVTTVYRRLKTPEFVARLNELKARGLEQTVAQLGQLSSQAASTLEKLLAAKSETVRLGAARAVIELGLKLRDQVELEQRIRDLEAVSLAPLQAPYRRSA